MIAVVARISHLLIQVLQAALSLICSQQSAGGRNQEKTKEEIIYSEIAHPTVAIFSCNIGVLTSTSSQTELRLLLYYFVNLFFNGL